MLNVYISAVILKYITYMQDVVPAEWDNACLPTREGKDIVLSEICRHQFVISNILQEKIGNF